MPQPKLNGRSITASFGVTEIQPGDTPETMLRRRRPGPADGQGQGPQHGRAVGQRLGRGPDLRPLAPPARPRDLILEQDLSTPVPVKIAVEQLRGFVSDHQARIVSVEGNNVRLQITDGPDSWMRRLSDRPVTFCLDLHLEEEELQAEPGKDAVTRTKIQVAMSPLKNRDRRREDVSNRAREVLTSFRSYMMATEIEPQAGGGVLPREAGAGAVAEPLVQPC